MAKVIETNLSMANGEIADFQSRIIEVESWTLYVNEIGNGDSINHPAYIGNMYGYSILPNAKVENFTYDEYHLSCDVYHSDGWPTKKLAYLIDESNGINLK
ncbi:hypothetical protein GCM10023310_69450 [Paenibacillus vulneris]|uniref:Uncharacterized protein n=1 Tax=Paenibacillus vulneris TaxID=1133364 RepID=A0ABW3UGG9_9BACL